MTEEEMFAYAMLAWVALMIGTLLTCALHLAQGMSASGENSRSEVEGEARQPDPQGAPNLNPETPHGQ